MQETHVGNKLRELRKARGLSQEEVARGVGTTRQTITSIEVGKYTASLPLRCAGPVFWRDGGGAFLARGRSEVRWRNIRNPGFGRKL